MDAPGRGCGGGRRWTGRTRKRCSHSTERGAVKTARRIITRSYEFACETSGHRRPVRLTADTRRKSRRRRGQEGLRANESLELAETWADPSVLPFVHGAVAGGATPPRPQPPLDIDAPAQLASGGALECVADRTVDSFDAGGEVPPTRVQPHCVRTSAQTCAVAVQLMHCDRSEECEGVGVLSLVVGSGLGATEGRARLSMSGGVDAPSTR